MNNKEEGPPLKKPRIDIVSPLIDLNDLNCFGGDPPQSWEQFAYQLGTWFDQQNIFLPDCNFNK